MAKRLKLNCDFVRGTASEIVLFGLHEKSRGTAKRVLIRLRFIELTSIVICDRFKIEMQS